MGVFVDLLERLQADIETVHGERLPLAWRFDPKQPRETRWRVEVKLPRKHRPACAVVCDGPDGETPMRRLAEDYAACAHLIRERAKGKKK